MRGGRGLRQQQTTLDPVTQIEHRLGNVDLVVVHPTIQPLEITERFQPRDTQATGTNRPHSGFRILRMANNIGRRNHDLRKTGPLRRRQARFQRTGKRGAIYSEIIEIHGFSAALPEKRGPVRT